MILLGIAFGLVDQDRSRVTEWIVSALVPAFVAPNVLKWHWWRFNGYGFFAGMVAGTAAAVIKVFMTVHPVFAFLLILAISFAASIVVCLLTEPESDEVLKCFYRNVRPWGFWEPVYRKCRRRRRRASRRTAISGATRSTSPSAWSGRRASSPVPIYLVIQHWKEMAISLAVFVATSAILKRTWYDHIAAGTGYLPDAEPAGVVHRK